MAGKIKYQGGVTKLLCQQLAAYNKKKFRNHVIDGKLVISNSTKIDYEIISLSGSSSFEDQMLSIYSFIHYAGIPLKWTIYSDKTYTEEQKRILEKKFSFVSIVDWDIYDFHIKNDAIKNYLAVCPLAKKLNIIIGHAYKRQTLYLDSDIIFYKNASCYLKSCLLKKGFWYVPDAIGDVKQYFNTARESIYPLNSGLLILNKEFNYSDVLQYLENLKGQYNWFSEQSSFEYAFRKQGALVLDPRQFVIDSSDQFDFSINYYPGRIAMRHYTGPVRHKMWQRGWKWHLNAC